MVLFTLGYYPNYQEIEGIWHYKDNVIRAHCGKDIRIIDLLMNLQDNFYGYGEDVCHCFEEETIEIDGVPSVFTSYPSMGMNFSNMSYALGCDEMGMPLVKLWVWHHTVKCTRNVFSKHNVAQQLEHVSLEHM